jgi:hypothetical protein
MKRSLITTLPDGTREEVDYSALAAHEIDRRIAQYERKYGMPLKRYAGTFSCDRAGHEEVFDLIDWQTLEEERSERAEAYLRAKR